MEGPGIILNFWWTSVDLTLWVYLNASERNTSSQSAGYLWGDTQIYL